MGNLSDREVLLIGIEAEAIRLLAHGSVILQRKVVKKSATKEQKVVAKSVRYSQKFVK